jgi:hypothetical protein
VRTEYSIPLLEFINQRILHHLSLGITGPATMTRIFMLSAPSNHDLGMKSSADSETAPMAAAASVPTLCLLTLATTGFETTVLTSAAAVLPAYREHFTLD